jgi:hypothetical protein
MQFNNSGSRSIHGLAAVRSRCIRKAATDQDSIGFSNTGRTERARSRNAIRQIE